MTIVSITLSICKLPWSTLQWMASISWVESSSLVPLSGDSLVLSCSQPLLAYHWPQFCLYFMADWNFPHMLLNVKVSILNVPSIGTSFDSCLIWRQLPTSRMKMARCVVSKMSVPSSTCQGICSEIAYGSLELILPIVSRVLDLMHYNRWERNRLSVAQSYSSTTHQLL